jgi:hypothetical protein
VQHRRDVINLRITVSQEPETVTMKLEGRVIGPWVTELQHAWHSLLASLGSKKLRVDLCGISHMDGNGRQVLSEIYKQTGADFLTDTPMTKYFADEARLQNRKDLRGRD